jgi:hypothetical protein
MRSLLAAAGAAALLAAPLATPPASAAGGVTIVCAATKLGRVSATCNAVGVVGTRVVRGQVQLDWTEAGSCPTSTANGTMTGALSLHFTWTRVGPTGVISTVGDLTGSGPVTWSSACADGGPASIPLVIHITGT